MDAAVGGMALCTEALKASLAKCARFQAWASLAGPPLTEAAALARIYIHGLPPATGNAAIYTLAQYQAYRPFATIWREEHQGYRMGKAGYPATVGERGELTVRLQKDVPAAVVNDSPALIRLWENDLGEIARQLLENATVDTCLLVDSVDILGPARSEDEHLAALGDFCEAVLSIKWGGGQL